MGRRGPQPQNLTGQRFGHLVVMEMVQNPKGKGGLARCRCDCGNEITARVSNLKNGNTKTCGCGRNRWTDPPSEKTIKAYIARQANLHRIRENSGKIEGMRFGRLVVVKETGKVGRHPEAVYLCHCDCGNEKEIRRSSLLSGTQSCGCLTVEETKSRFTTHGDTTSKSSNKRLYGIWACMKERCLNENFRDYYRYGGRGITVCDEWKDWVAFRDWALSHGYAEDLTIERRDNEQGYRPDNCIWIPLGLQMKNTRKTIHIPYKGKMYCAMDFHRLTGLPYDFVRNQAHRGFSGEDIVEEAHHKGLC